MTSRVLVSLRVAASPEHAFSVFVADIGAWWRPNVLFRFTPRSPGILAFESGPGGRLTESFADGEVFQIGRITIWEPGARLAFTWRQASFAPEQATQVEVRFEPLDAETRVTVEHCGWDTVPQDHVARHRFPDAVFLRRHAEWWQLLLAGMAQATAITDLREWAAQQGVSAEETMSTSSDLRRLALSLQGTIEAPHFDRTAFRARRIYVTLATDGQTANFMFTPDQQQFKCMMAPEAFAPVPNAWGRRGATAAILANLTIAELQDALRMAWSRAVSNKAR